MVSNNDSVVTYILGMRGRGNVERLHQLPQKETGTNLNNALPISTIATSKALANSFLSSAKGHWSLH